MFSKNWQYVIKIQPHQFWRPTRKCVRPFLVYNFPKNIKLAHFADDIPALCKAETNLLASQRIQDLATQIEEWCSQWRVAVNQFTYLRHVDKHPITFNGEPIQYTESVKYLGVVNNTHHTHSISLAAEDGISPKPVQFPTELARIN
jgi:hypothetical protein